MVPSVKDPSDLTHGGEFGKPGPQESANSSYGWQLMIAAGHQTGVKKFAVSKVLPPM
jgi:hypothetical protein